MCKKENCLIACVLLLGIASGVTQADIIAYWPFDEGAGDVATDVVNGAEAQLTDIDWVPDRTEGSAAESSRGGDTILVDPPLPWTTEDLSIAWWMVDNYESYQTLMNKYEDSSTAGFGMLLRPEGEDSPLRFRIGGFQAYGGWGTECRVPQGAYRDGEWTHVVCTYDSASDTATIYINGELKPNGDYNPKTGIAGAGGYCDGVNDPEQPFYIVGQREPFGGIVDDLALWDNAISADEVMAVYALGPLMLDPNMAGDPRPEDEAIDVLRDVILQWNPGDMATQHDVYFGQSFDEVDNVTTASALYQGRQPETTFAPGRLEFDTTYYWRIDEVRADFTILKGTVWSFTTELLAYPIEGIVATSNMTPVGSDQGPENTVNGSGLNDNGEHSTETTDMWLATPGGEEPMYIQFDFDRTYKLHAMEIWNHNFIFETAVGFGVKDVTVEYSVDGTEWTSLEDAQLAQAPGVTAYTANTTIALDGVAAKAIRLIVRSSFGGAGQYGLSEVRVLAIPVVASEPSPADGATDVAVDSPLNWRPGREAVSHEVYLGTDPNALTNVGAATEPHYDAELELDTQYTWQIVEVNDAEAVASWVGDVWSFSTQEYVVVDNFESYTDDMDTGKAIFQTWVDGVDDSSKGGSVVGYDTAPNGTFGETTVVHGGSQSMPFAYDNTSAAYSETTRTFAASQDWSRYGIKALVFWFRGADDNAMQQMYVKINDTKVLYDGDAESLQRAGWQMWYIDLTAPGLPVRSVSSLSIGFDRLGGVNGQGLIFIDDLRLYAHDRELVTPIAPDPAGLVGQWKLDETSGLAATDSSGTGNNGTLMNMTGTEWTTGVVGGALELDGLEDWVDCGNDPSLQLADELTIAAWVKMEPGNEGAYMGIAGKLTATPEYNGFGLVRHSSNVFRMWVAAAGTILDVSSDVTYTDAEWHHVAGIRKNGIGSLYVDGFEQVAKLTSELADSGSFAFIGRQYDQDDSNAGRFWNGAVDEVRLYNRGLSTQEVAGLAGRTAPFDMPF